MNKELAINILTGKVFGTNEERNEAVIMAVEALSTQSEPCEDTPSAQPPKGEWVRMSNLSEKYDNRYICSHCGNVVHHKSTMDLYTFNSWCGRCGSDNRRHRKFAELKGEEDE